MKSAIDLIHSTLAHWDRSNFRSWLW